MTGERVLEAGTPTAAAAIDDALRSAGRSVAEREVIEVELALAGLRTFTEAALARVIEATPAGMSRVTEVAEVDMANRVSG